jgi:hypothetical protein
MPLPQPLKSLSYLDALSMPSRRQHLLFPKTISTMPRASVQQAVVMAGAIQMELNQDVLRRKVILWSLLAGLSLAFSIGVLWPYIVAGDERLEPWKRVLLHIIDLTPFSWFCYFLARHVILGRDFRNITVDEYRKKQWYRKVGCSVLVASLLATLLIIYQGHEEWAGRQRAVIAQGQATSVSMTRHPKNEIDYIAPYVFLDGQGHRYSGVLYTGETNGQFGNPLPPEVQEALRKQEAPFTLNIDYDPEWPSRNWPTEVGRLMDNAHVLLFTLLSGWFQLFPLYLFAVSVRNAIREHKLVPWWHELVEIVPLAVQVGVLLVMALIVCVS